MTQTFKVGDKVVNDVFGPGEIVYGPYGDDDSSYFMKGDDGLHHTVSSSLLKRASKFKVGDKVKSRAGTTYTVEAGPFFAPGEWYALKATESGNVLHSHADEVSPVEPADEAVKVGDVVRILEDDAFRADVKAGDLFEVKRVFSDGWDGETRIKVDAGPGARMEQWTFRPQDFEKVEADKVAVHDGVVYDLTARYRDRDGDYWSFKDVDGTVRGNCAPTNIETDVFDWCDSLESAVRQYGPLTRV